MSDWQLRACLTRARFNERVALIRDAMIAMLKFVTAAALTTVITEENRSSVGVLAIGHHHDLLAPGADHTNVLRRPHRTLVSSSVYPNLEALHWQDALTLTASYRPCPTAPP
ncbi:hypothetical protein [Rhodococcus pyridinivorans]|uniref:hypothetical protein n=1 Tax=Rhodococcus pyridinivorans TaxID=103816 RepID=UPI00228479D6|nr:hypothetical protein [Rhodococcus pyridinivorans]WAL49224.1 hypothetical protein OQN32_26435 [Rhodococcus pyridinivorans]